MPDEAKKYETKPDLRCLLEELSDVSVLPFGWVMLRREPDSDPEDGFVHIKYLSGNDVLADKLRLLAANERLKEQVDRAIENYKRIEADRAALVAYVRALHDWFNIRI